VGEAGGVVDHHRVAGVGDDKDREPCGAECGFVGVFCGVLAFDERAGNGEVEQELPNFGVVPRPRATSLR
jgi:hypothetical protein